MANISVTTVGSDDEESKKQTLKMQKKEYRHEKKRVAKELITALKDPTVVVMADWLKIRGTLRKWTRFYCVLKPGILLVYKSPKTNKHGYWVGTVLLNTCELIERPSKKDGFCFKLFHPLDQSIWATRGPRGESLGAVTFQPLPTTHLICRAASEEAGQCWMDALELSLRCSGLLMRTMHKLNDATALSPNSSMAQSGHSTDSRHNSFNEALMTPAKDSGDAWSADDINVDIDVLRKLTTGSVIDVIGKPNASRNDLTETEAEKHFDAVSGLDDEDYGTESDTAVATEEQMVKESPYIESLPEQFGSLGASDQTEEVAEENKSLLWLLLKQVRPGMDLSKVVLPTFILEPRSFLEKLADYYYHADLLTEAVNEQDPYKRMINVVRFYLSGFYKKPKGLKKPYNPILGEQFRCYFSHPDGTHTYYVAEQVSHHPPVSALFVSNRQAGFNVSGTIFAKSKFYGNSLSAMMNGEAKITLLGRGESYSVTLPYAYCKGLIVGTLSMELGGQVTITCDRTSYTCELDFKLKPFLGGSMNGISGKVKLGKETLAEIDGYWDGEINLTERATGRKTLLWKPSPDVIKRRLKRFEVPFDQLGNFESRKLWNKVTEAIQIEDQHMATEEKTVLEQAQRERAKELKANNDVHRPKAFELDPSTDFYQYKHADFRPWDPHNDLRQLECDYVIRSVAKHKTPLIRSNSVGSVYQAADEVDAVSDESSNGASRKKRKRRARLSPQPVTISKAVLDEALKPLQSAIERAEQQLSRMQHRIDSANGQSRNGAMPFYGLFEQLGVAIVFAVVQAILLAYLLRR